MAHARILLPAMLFPLVFYVFFGIVFNFSAAQGEYMLVSYACFGMMGPALFNYATAVASDRAIRLAYSEACLSHASFCLFGR